jgi:hypothetical protein
MDTRPDRRLPRPASMIRTAIFGLIMIFLGLFGLYFISE